MRRLWTIAIILIGLSSCARQGSIPNPDIFPPHLISISSSSNTQITLHFDEELDSTAYISSLYTVTPVNSSGASPRIRFITRDPDESRNVVLITSPLQIRRHFLRATASDRRGNISKIKTSFKPSARRDTLAPLVRITPITPRTSFPYEIEFKFNEPVDTSKSFMLLTAPQPDTNHFILSWERNLMHLSLRIRDTLLAKKPFYAVLLPGVSDFTGNRRSNLTDAFVYADTSIDLNPIFGKLTAANGAKASNALVLFYKNDSLFAATGADSAGIFYTNLAVEPPFRISAYYDAQNDGSYENAGNLTIESFNKDTLRIPLSPIAPAFSIENILSP